MPNDPKRDAEKTEEAGLLGMHEEAPSIANPSLPSPSVTTPPQGPLTAPRPSKQDRLDLERSSGEGMTGPTSNP